MFLSVGVRVEQPTWAVVPRSAFSLFNMRVELLIPRAALFLRALFVDLVLESRNSPEILFVIAAVSVVLPWRSK